MASVKDSETVTATERNRMPTERSRLGGASTLVAAVALIAVAGERWPVAVIGALVILSVWYLLPPPYAFALGNVALVAVLPEIDLMRTTVVEVGLLGALLTSATTAITSDRHLPIDVSGVLLVLGWVLVGGVLAWASIRSLLRLPVAAVLLVALTALTAYGLHRYQLVAIGVIGE